MTTLEDKKRSMECARIQSIGEDKLLRAELRQESGQRMRRLSSKTKRRVVPAQEDCYGGLWDKAAPEWPTT